jgi:hypothetical protein
MLSEAKGDKTFPILPVKVDYRGTAMMSFNKIIQASVGADLSRPSPIYRPPGDVI